MPASSVGSSCLQLGVPTKRERTKYTEYQLAYLESIFRTTNYPDGARREEIARQLQLTDVKVQVNKGKAISMNSMSFCQVWFKNRRAKVSFWSKLHLMALFPNCSNEMSGSLSR